MDYLKSIAGYSQYLIAAVAGALAAYWGTLPDGLQVMAKGAGIIFLANMVTGSIVAWDKKEFSSRGAGKSLRKLMIYCSGLLLAHGLDVGLSLGVVCVAPMLLVIFVMEGSSVVENLAALGLPMPAAITERLERLRGELKEAETDADS